MKQSDYLCLPIFNKEQEIDVLEYYLGRLLTDENDENLVNKYLQIVTKVINLKDNKFFKDKYYSQYSLNNVMENLEYTKVYSCNLDDVMNSMTQKEYALLLVDHMTKAEDFDIDKPYIYFDKEDTSISKYGNIKSYESIDLMPNILNVNELANIIIDYGLLMYLQNENQPILKVLL